MYNILEPTDINIKAIINNEANNNNNFNYSTPKIIINCTIPNIQLNFDEDQYHNLLFIIKKFANYRKSINVFFFFL